MSQKSSPPQIHMVPKVANGGIAGVTALLIVFPLDLVKTRLQNQPIGPNGEKMYNNMLDCFRKTYRAEGFLGMYKGLAINVLLNPIEKAIKLSANDYFRWKFTTADGKLPLTIQMLAGGCAGICQNVITTPMELLKIRMQDSGRAAALAKKEGKAIEKLTALKISTQLFKEKGVFGLYRGSGATLFRDVVFSVVYFPMFAALNSLGPQREDGTGEAVFWCSLLAGLGAGAFSALFVTPLDVVKTRLQSGAKQYNGIIDCTIKTWKHEGFTAFFKGGLCRMIVLGPQFAITQAVYYFGIAEAILGYEKPQVR